MAAAVQCVRLWVPLLLTTGAIVLAFCLLLIESLPTAEVVLAAGGALVLAAILVIVGDKAKDVGHRSERLRAKDEAGYLERGVENDPGRPHGQVTVARADSQPREELVRRAEPEEQVLKATPRNLPPDDVLRGAAAVDQAPPARYDAAVEHPHAVAEPCRTGPSSVNHTRLHRDRNVATTNEPAEGPGKCDSAQIDEATNEVKAWFTASLDSGEKDVLRQLVMSEKEEEELEETVLAECEEEDARFCHEEPPENQGHGTPSTSAGEPGTAEPATSSQLTASGSSELQDRQAAIERERQAEAAAAEAEERQREEEAAAAAAKERRAAEDARQAAEQTRSDALASLDAAIASKETGALRSALQAADAADVPAGHPLVVKARGALADADALLVAHSELVAARKAGNLGQLRSALEAARAAGVDQRTIGGAEETLANLVARERATSSIRASLESNDARALIAALAEAEGAGLRSESVASAKKALRKLEAHAAASAALRADAQGRDEQGLRDALQVARAEGVDPEEISSAEQQLAAMEVQTAAERRLAAAIAAREVGALEEALREAAAAGLDEGSPPAADAKSVLAELEATASARAELKAAVKAGDADRLRSALEVARGTSVNPIRIASAEKELAAIEARVAAVGSLEAAILSKDVGTLRAALEDAASAGLASDHEKVQAAQASLEEADQLLATRTELIAASRSSDIDRLKAALVAGREAGVDAQVIAAAEEDLANLEAKKAAIAAAAAELEAAVAAVQESPDRLRTAISQAEELRAAPQADLDAAAAALDTEERRRAAVAELDAAVASRELARLHVALDAAAAASVSAECAEVARAQQVVKEEERKVELRQELVCAAEAEEKDIGQLRAAIDRAAGAGVGTEEDVVVNAQKALAHEERRRAALVELVAASEAGEAARANDPERLQAIRDRLLGAISVARALGFGDANREVFEAELKRRHVHNMLQDLLGATRVFCRVRPLNSRELRLDSPVVVNIVGGMSVECTDEEGDEHKFEFDAAFGPESTQEQIFVECRDLVQSVLDGYNITIFAYGQTGAGKTFTMMGANDPPELKGVCPRTIEALFEAIARQAERYEIQVKAHMVEVYCATINDLTATEDNLRDQPRNHRWKKDRGIKVRCINDEVTLEGVQEHLVSNAQELFQLLLDGNNAKKVTATAMNPSSSRSHTVLTINVYVTNRDTQKSHRGKILLVDLAGSERLKKSEVTGAARKEAIEINKSLTALGDVISAVTLGKRVPYRNHTLTLLMSDSLGGTAKTLMFVNASPALDNADETVMALQFATRAKTITTREAAVIKLQALRRGIIGRREARSALSRFQATTTTVITSVRLRRLLAEHRDQE